MEFIWKTINEINKGVADRMKIIRKRRKISQSALSNMANVSLGSLKRFESTGNISLSSLTKLAQALDCINEIDTLFANVEYKSFEEIKNDKRN